MRKLYFLFFLSLLIAIVSYNSFAQEDVLRPSKKYYNQDDNNYFGKSPWTIGVEAGLNYNMFTQDLSWNDQYLLTNTGFPHGTVFDGLHSASGFSPHFGIFADYSFSKTIAVQLRISYDSKSYGVSTSGNDIAFNPITFSYGSHPIDLKVDATSTYVTITPLLRINFTDNFFMTIGPTIHYLSGDIATKWQVTSTDGTPLDEFGYWNLIMPGNIAPTGTTTLHTDAGTTETSISPRVGIEAGLGYKYQLGPGVYLVPQGRFQFMVDKVTNIWGWYLLGPPQVQIETTDNKLLNSLVFAIGLWFEL